MNIIARKTSEFLSLRRESALCAFAFLGLSHSSSYIVILAQHAEALMKGRREGVHRLRGSCDFGLSSRIDLVVRNGGLRRLDEDAPRAPLPSPSRMWRSSCRSAEYPSTV